MRTKSRAGGRRKLPRPRDPPALSSTFPLAMLSNQNTNMLETSEKELHGGGEDEDWLKKDTCIRCDERGSLLICNVSGCPIAVHENCMSCKPTFDDERNFYCPYCSYKRALIQAHKLEKKVMAAKKALSSFIGSGVPIGNKSEQKDAMSEKVQDQSVQVEHNQHVESSEKTKSRILSDDEGDHLRSYAADDSDIDSSESDAEAVKDFTTVENFSKANVDGRLEEVELSPNTNFESHANYAGGDTPLKRKRNDKGKAHKIKRQQKSGFPKRSPHTTDKDIEGNAAKNAEEVSTSKYLEENHESFKLFEKTQSDMVSDDDGSQPDPYATDVKDSLKTESELLKDSMSKESYSDGDDDGRLDERELPVSTNLGSPKHAGGEAPLKQKRRVKSQACKIKKQHNSDFPRRSFRALNKEFEKDPANKIEDFSMSKMSRKDLNSVKKIKTPILSNTKRRRLQWTTEEEEMLREGVQKFSTSVNKNLPWRKILEFGNHVFDMTRSPVDLKDKWRKIQARESFSE